MIRNLKFIYDESPFHLFGDSSQNKQKQKKEGSLAIDQFMKCDQLYGDGKRKQMKIDQIKEENRLEKMLQEIEFEESKPNISTVSKKLTAGRKTGGFYEYNKEWAHRIGEKKQQLREEQFYAEAQQEQQREYQTKQLVNKNQYSSNLLNYSGPISGWHSRFENYLNTKIKMQEIPEEDITFKPKLNPTSLRMTSNRDKTPIENRLLQYGEDLKVKHEIERKQNEILKGEAEESGFGKPQINQYYNYGESDGTQVHNKLYEQARTLEEKMQGLREEVQSQFKFHPVISPIPKKLQEKIAQRRKPLHEPQKNVQPEMKKQAKPFNQVSFESFLERGYKMVDKKIENSEKQQYDMIEKQLNECTFQPKTNVLKRSTPGFSVQLSNQNTIYERELEKKNQRQQALDQKKRSQAAKLQAIEQEQCTFKPNLNQNLIQEKKLVESQNAQKEEERKQKLKSSSVTQINYLKQIFLARPTQVDIQNFESNPNDYVEEILDSVPVSQTIKSKQEQDRLSMVKPQKPKWNKITQKTPSKEPNFQEDQFNLNSARKSVCPSPKLNFRSYSLSESSQNKDSSNNSLNASQRNDSDGKSNSMSSSFLKNPFNNGLSQISNNNYNLESLLNQSIFDSKLSPQRMSKIKIQETFSKIEKQLTTNVQVVDEHNSKILETHSNLSNHKLHNQYNNSSIDQRLPIIEPFQEEEFGVRFKN